MTDAPGIASFDPAMIPAALKELRWAGARLPDKAPRNTHTGLAASLNVDADWCSFDEALAALAFGHVTVLGVRLTRDAGITAIDLDDCRDPETGELSLFARQVIRDLDSYTETSVSGTGIHAFLLGRVPEGRHVRPDVELYDAGRFMIVTGQQLAGTPTTIEARQPALTELHARCFPASPPARRTTPEVLDRVTGNRPGDDFNRRATWEEVLIPHGWQVAYQRGEVTAWRRPGKTTGISATTNHGGSDLFWPFSSSTVFEAQRSYDKFAAVAVLEHGGDFAAAAEALRRRGYGADPSAPRETPAPRSVAIAAAAVQVQITMPAAPLANLTESATAELFAEAHKGVLRYDARHNGWFYFTGTHFIDDAVGRRYDLAVAFARAQQVAALDLPDQKLRQQQVAWWIRQEDRRRLENTLALAQHHPLLVTAGNDWDQDVWVLNTPSGIVNLRSGTLRPARPDDHCLLITQAPFDPSALCPLWDHSITEIFNGDELLVTFFQRAVGYSLSGDTSEQVLFICYGGGANGKGTALNTLLHTMGSYGWNMPFSTLELHQRSAIPNDVAALVGRRFVTASETSEGARFNEARIKSVTGCDPLTARFLHGEYFSFEPVATFFLSVNHKPAVRDDTHAFWRRVRLIPFVRTFPINRRLRPELEAEAPGILRWAVDGCLAWQREGLDPPAAVVAATDQYRAESDVLAEFFEGGCDLSDPTAETGAMDLFKHYVSWCDGNGVPRSDRLSLKVFGSKLRERFAHVRRGSGIRYIGIEPRRPGEVAA